MPALFDNFGIASGAQDACKHLQLGFDALDLRAGDDAVESLQVAAQLTRGHAHLVDGVPLVGADLRVVGDQLVAVCLQRGDDRGGGGVLVHVRGHHGRRQRSVINGTSQRALQLRRRGRDTGAGADEQRRGVAD